MVSNMGFYISEEEYKARMKKIKDKNESKERRRNLREERKKYGFKLKLPSTSKLIVLVVFLMCLELLIYAEYAMIALNDASAMYVLLGIPVTLIPTVISYFNKSKAENTANGIVYEKTMYEMHSNEE